MPKLMFEYHWEIQRLWYLAIGKGEHRTESLLCVCGCLMLNASEFLGVHVKNEII